MPVPVSGKVFDFSCFKDAVTAQDEGKVNGKIIVEIRNIQIHWLSRRIMNQEEKRLYLIRTLLNEQTAYRKIKIPADPAEQKLLLRSLFNVRMPGKISADFLGIQDEYLQEETRRKGITDLADLTPVSPGIYLWLGDITTLRCDAIVNAANSGMTGCYQPCHNCIDNCIHTYAGIQLRNACAEIMAKQGYEEPTGRAKITPAFNLPCRYVLHTVGPIVNGPLSAEHEALLMSCYRSCLELAAENGIGSIAFCCISTGLFGFPQLRAAEIAVHTIKYPFWNMTAGNPEAVYACLNYGEAFCPEQILDRSICIDGDISMVISDLAQDSSHDDQHCQRTDIS